MASKRRDYGAGSVYQKHEARHGCPPLDADGERPAHKCAAPWVGAYSQGWTERGTRRRVSVTADTEAEAKRRLRKKVQEIEAGATAEASTRKTVKAWADEWLPIVERDLRPSSMTATLSATRKWIVPTIGHKRLADLAPADVRAVMEAIRKAGWKSSTQRRAHSVLMQLLKDAQAEGYQIAPRVLAVKAPAKSVSDRTDIPVADAVKMLEVASTDPAGARWVAGFLQGMRQGEVLGLTREAVDLERGILILSWQLQPLPYNVTRDRSSGFRVPDGHEARQVRGRWHLVRPKSDAGWRVIPLLPWMTDALRAWFEIMPESPHGIVWHHPVGDPYKIDDAAFYALQEATGVRHATRLNDDGTPAYFTAHEMRHTTATLLLEAGVDPAIITAIIGHSSIVTTRGYQHVNAAPLAAAMEKVAERLALTPKR